jgi:protocatechuate 3,4-dioxygenase beta subunit
MKQSTGLSGIFSGISSKGGLAVRASLFALLASILILAEPGIGTEPATALLDLRSKSLPAASFATDDNSTDLVSENMKHENEDPEPTPSVTEGPYFKPGSPERKSLLEPGVVGDRLNLTGRVLTRSGKPIAGALLDFWQADGNGRYDNAGYKLRGHQLTDDQGRYYLETVVPGNYGGRTRHIHVKIQAPGEAVLTTQLFFPGEENNQRDSIFTPELLVSLNETEKGQEATFDFVLDTQ